MPEDLKREINRAFLEDRELVKQAMREGMNEWLDKQYAKVGRWTIATLGVIAISALVYLMQHLGRGK